MSKPRPVDPRVRLAIARWPDDAPRGAVSTFCAEHEISRKTFYVLRARAREEGQAAVLEPRSRRPKNSPSQIAEKVKLQAVAVRKSLESSGLDHGPISVFEKMKSMGIAGPSVAALARIFREKGEARAEPKKKPRAAYRRFVYPAPNACWQLDATEYVLTGGRKCVIFQLEDDHARLAVASHVAKGETAHAAVAVFKKGVAARGVPQRLLTDNGLALNPIRRGWTGQLTAYAASLGVEAITGKPYKPTTQGKNERFHQTLFRFLDKQPMAEAIEQLQAQVDEFDRIYNTERPHQALPGRVTPAQAWDATPVAEPPRPRIAHTDIAETAPTSRWPAVGEAERRVRAKGVIGVIGVRFTIGQAHAGSLVRVLWDPDTVAIYDEQGTELNTFARPAPGITAVGNGKPGGFMAHHKPKPSPMS